jgi:hypothetical protein
VIAVIETSTPAAKRVQTFPKLSQWRVVCAGLQENPVLEQVEINGKSVLVVAFCVSVAELHPDCTMHSRVAETVANTEFVALCVGVVYQAREKPHEKPLTL